jgi:hypothetical protein
MANAKLGAMKLTQLKSSPFPVFGVACPRAGLIGRSDSFIQLIMTLHKHLPDAMGGCYRCCDISRLRTVAITGIDVVPSDAVIYASHDLGKSLEYGSQGDCGDQLLLLLKPDRVQRSWRKTPSDISAVDLNQISVNYPTRKLSLDGCSFWHSRLAEGDNHIDTVYEENYGFWVPDNPLEALYGVIILCDDESRFPIHAALINEIGVESLNIRS